MNTAPTPRDDECLKEIRRVCTPKPLDGKELNRFFIETDKSRDPHQNTRERLKQALLNDSDVRLLFCGHRGCGKSTELNKFLAENSDEFLPVKFSVLREMSPFSIHAEDLLLVMAWRAMETAKEAKIKVDEGLLKPILEYFAKVEEISTTGNRKSAQAGAGVGVGGPVFKGLLDFFVKASAEVKFESHNETTVTAKLRRRPADLLANVDSVFLAIRKALNGQKKSLLIIVEDLDKLDIVQARKLYVENTQLLTGISSNIIYTIPIFLFHSPDVGTFRHHFDDVINQRMIQILDPPDKRIEGFQAVKAIVKRRVGKGLIIEEDALNCLVENTAGVLRHVFDALHYAASKVDAHIPLCKEDIDYGLRQLGQDIQPQISLPRESLENGPKSRDELLDRLVQYATKQNKGEKPAPESDPVTQLLLQSCALVEYNGEGWFGVHPLVVSYLKRLGRMS